MAPPTTKRNHRVEALSIIRAAGIFAVDNYKDGAKEVLQSDDWAKAYGGNSLQIHQLKDLNSLTLRELPTQCIRLPQLVRGDVCWVPLLWVISHPKGGLIFQLVLAGLEKRYGFRWDPPEAGGVGDSKHDYYHAQPIRTVRLERGDIDLELGHDGICDHFPAFPIDADDLVHLADSLLVSLYGAKYTDEILVNEPKLREQIHGWSKGCGWDHVRGK